ncbi:MAG: divalent-cation tolerance protein CutA [Thermodesulfobacteriota bacterium]|jgi:periplasmic divalent cation tolerance protein
MEEGWMSALLMISGSRTEKEARKIAKTLVEGRLAACVNIIPRVNSFFYWEGKLCVEREAMILIKTTSKKSKVIMNKIKEVHSYEVPEIVFLEVDGGEKKYLEWVNKMVGGKKILTKMFKGVK